MRTKQHQVWASLERVQLFCANHLLETPPPGYTANVAALGALIPQVQAWAVKQEAEHGRTMGSVREEHAARAILRNRYMLPLRQTAKVLLGDVPGIDQQFQVPLAQASTPTLVVKARAMAEQAQVHADRFIAAGQSPDFVAQLLSAVSAVEDAVSGRDTSRGGALGATAGLRSVLAQARGKVSLLDAVIRVRFEQDSATLAEWREAKRVVLGPPGRRARQAAPSQSATPTLGSANTATGSTTSTSLAVGAPASTVVTPAVSEVTKQTV